MAKGVLTFVAMNVHDRETLQRFPVGFFHRNIFPPYHRMMRVSRVRIRKITFGDIPAASNGDYPSERIYCARKTGRTASKITECCRSGKRFAELTGASGPDSRWG